MNETPERLLHRIATLECEVERLRALLAAQANGCAHERVVVKAADGTFAAQRGCLDCNEWIDPVRFAA